MTKRILSLAIVFASALLLDSTAGARQATPAVEDNLSLLVVQSFASGQLAPEDGGGGLATLTFEPPASDALFFSERPNRVVGTYSAAELLEFVRQAETDPLNAALVANLEEGGEVQAVVELLGGEIDTAGTVRYQVRLLGEAGQTGLNLEAQSLSELGAPLYLASGHLFIDDLGQHKDNPT